MNDKEKIAMLVGFLNGMFVRGENFTVVSRDEIETLVRKVCQGEKPDATAA